MQELARKRLREARVLLHAAEFDGAYYLTGLAIECGLKACIAKRTKRSDFPDKDVVNASYTHNLTGLVRAAGLEAALDTTIKTDPTFSINWNTVKDWKIESRYTETGPAVARDLYKAVASRRHGVMNWIRHRW